jgi:hypothetical protein
LLFDLPVNRPGASIGHPHEGDGSQANARLDEAGFNFSSLIASTQTSW